MLAHLELLDYHVLVEPNTIAIQLADRSFFSVMDIRNAGRRRLTLAAGQTDQAHIEIHLFRIPEAGAPPVQIGSLFLSDISDTTDSGIIHLDLDLDEDGNLAATVTETATGNSASRLVSVWETPEAFISDTPADEDEQSYMEEGEISLQQRSSRKDVGVTALIVLLLLLIVTAGLVGYLWWLRSEDTAAMIPVGPEREVVVAPSPSVFEVDPEPTESLDPVPAEEVVELAPVLVLPEETLETQRAYRILRGDTLWSISDRFYGTPWRFSELARRNQIRNPNIIFPEDCIIIPEK
jgi:hypothetical protein